VFIVNLAISSDYSPNSINRLVAVLGDLQICW